MDEALEREDMRVRVLKQLLLNYLQVRARADPAVEYARQYYLCEWYEMAEETETIEQATVSRQLYLTQTQRTELTKYVGEVERCVSGDSERVCWV